MGMTIADIWETFLESEDNSIELELPSLEDARKIKRAISVYKSKQMQEEVIRNLIGDMRLTFDINKQKEGGVLLTITSTYEPLAKSYDAKVVRSKEDE